MLDAPAAWPDNAPDLASTQVAAGVIWLTGAVGRSLLVAPGEKRTVTFVVTWNFPNLSVAGMEDVGREYASRFSDATAVARYVARNFQRLSTTTRRWRDTWYDSSLPHWFLDRTMTNTTTRTTRLGRMSQEKRCGVAGG